jgi:hypothetical protein
MHSFGVRGKKLDPLKADIDLPLTLVLIDNDGLGLRP